MRCHKCIDSVDDNVRSEDHDVRKRDEELTTPLTSFVILEEIFRKTSGGNGNQSAVIKSSVCTARNTIT